MFKRLVIGLLLVLLTAGPALAAGERLVVVYLLGDGYVTLLVRVPLHAENRKLVVNWDVVDGPAGHEARQIDGDQQDRETYTFRFPFRAGMHYIFVVSLVDSKGKTKTRTVEVGG